MLLGVCNEGVFGWGKFCTHWNEQSHCMYKRMHLTSGNLSDHFVWHEGCMAMCYVCKRTCFHSDDDDDDDYVVKTQLGKLRYVVLC